MTAYHHNPFRPWPVNNKAPEKLAELSISSKNKARVRVKVIKADEAWSVDWGDGQVDYVGPGTDAMIHEYFDTRPGRQYTVRLNVQDKQIVLAVAYP
jgi:hypothetical protein